MVPFKTERNLKRSDLSEMDKDKERLLCLSARPHLQAAEMPGVDSHKQTTPPSKSRKKTGCGHPGFLYLSLLAPSCSFSLPVGVLRSLLPATMFRALVDEPGFPPTDKIDHTECAVRALMPTLASSPPHVCHRQGTGLSPVTRTCSRTSAFKKRLHIYAFRSRQKTTIQKNCDYFPETQLSLVLIAKRVFRPAERHLQGKRKSVPQTNTSARK